MTETLSWWLAVEVMGLVAFPLAYVFFPRFPDRGYAFAKPFGLLIIGFVFWVLGSARVLSNSPGGIVWAIILVGAGSGYVVWRRKDEMRRFLQEQWRLLLVIEGIFFLAFIFAAFLRSYVPDIAGTEKPMDFAFLNASTHTQYFAPNDPWLSGHTISYYYGGYFLVAMTGNLAGVATAIGYNLGLAMVAALAVVSAFGLVYNLVALHGRGDGGTREWRVGSILVWPLVFGLAASLLLTVMANLEGFLEFLAAHGVGSAGFWHWVDIKGLTSVGNSTDKWYPTQFWWWWHAARIVSPNVPETITEFPFFSFLLGDLHPHVMAIPFGVLATATGVRLLQEEETLDVRFWTRHPWLLAAMAILVGGLSFFNTWDLPTFFFLLVVAAFVRNFLALRRWETRLLTQTLGFALPLAAAAVLAYVPYHKAFIPQFGFASQADGIAPVDSNGTLPFHALVFWGPFAVLVIPFAVQRFVASLKRRPWQQQEWLAAVPSLLVLLFWLLWVAQKGRLGDAVSSRGSAWLTAIILLAILTLLLATLRREMEADAPKDKSIVVLAALLTASLAVLLIIGAEFFFIRDVFGNRMNTVFKFYYQAWILLAVSGGFALYYLVMHWLGDGGVRWGWRAGWGCLAAIILAAAMLYPLGATFARTEGFTLSRSLDGLAWAERQYPDDYHAAQWLSQNVSSSDVVVEMVGSQSVGFDYGIAGRIAAWTGMSTVLSWPGHEDQWRGSYAPFEGRQDDVDTLYSTEDTAKAAAIVQKYGIDYIYVGTLERETYPAGALEKFDSMYPVAQQFGDAVIYQVTGTNAAAAR
jgi:YYY domain-containing protein